MGENYMYVVTRASEEAIELLGYTLIFLGSLEYFFSLKLSRPQQLNTNEKITRKVVPYLSKNEN